MLSFLSLGSLYSLKRLKLIFLFVGMYHPMQMLQSAVRGRTFLCNVSHLFLPSSLVRANIFHWSDFLKSLKSQQVTSNLSKVLIEELLKCSTHSQLNES